MRKKQGKEAGLIVNMHEARTAKENTDTIEDVTQKFPWKKYEELTFADDFMFCKVLTDRPDLCQEMVEIITGRKVREVRNLVPQRSQKEYYDGKTSIFLNASSSKMPDGELKDFLQYVGKKVVSSNFTKHIDEEVKKVIDDHNGRRLYMLLEEKLQEATAYGEKRGRQEGAILDRISACLDFGLSKEETKQKIMEVFGLSSVDADAYMKLAGVM